MKKEEKKTAHRRNFLKTAAAAASLSAVILPGTGLAVKHSSQFQPGPGNKFPGRIILNYNNKHTATPNGGSADDVTKIQAMVDESIKLLASTSDIGAAWKTVFPANLSASSKIAIKINMLNANIPSHPLVVKAIVEGLKQMDFNGTKFPAANIFIYDSNNSSSFNGAGFKTEWFTGVTLVKDKQSAHPDGAMGGRNYSDTLFNCDFLINTASLRGHGIKTCSGGFTLGFKSHFGTYVSPGGLHNDASSTTELNCDGVVYKKNVLTVICALYGLKEGTGPSGSWGNGGYYLEYAKTKDPTVTDTKAAPNTLIFSTDPVTAEFQAIKIMKVNTKKPYTITDMPSYLTGAAGVNNAKYNIGIIDETKMKYGEIVNGKITVDPGSTSVNTIVNPLFAVQHASMQVHCANRNVLMDIMLPHSYVGQTIKAAIFDMKGALIKNIEQQTRGQHTRMAVNLAQEKFAAGMYIVSVSVDNINLKAKFIL